MMLKKERTASSMKTALTPFEEAIERRTGMTVEEIRQRPVAELRRRSEARWGFRTRVRSFWPFIGRGNVMHGAAKSREQVEATLDEALR